MSGLNHTNRDYVADAIKDAVLTHPEKWALMSTHIMSMLFILTYDTLLGFYQDVAS
jgi:hypothetical protein